MLKSSQPGTWADSGPLRRLDHWPRGRALGAGVLGGGAAVLALPLLGIGGWPAWLVPVAVLALALSLAVTARPIARRIPDEPPTGEEMSIQAESEPVSPSLYFDPPDLDALPLELHEDLVLRQIPAGDFMMGSAGDDPAGRESERPQHQVMLPPFELMAFQVTRRLYREVMGKDSGFPEGEADRRPVNNVSWEDAVRFCNTLSRRLGLNPCYSDENGVRDTAKDGLRLPTEAEWEYAARAGSDTKWCFGDDEARLEAYAVYGRGWEEGPQPVGSRKPNVWGLCDMHGNVWEWVEDPWHDDYKRAPDNGSAWIHDDKSDTIERVLRGGSFVSSAAILRSANRNRHGATDWGDGFRCARFARQH